MRISFFAHNKDHSRESEPPIVVFVGNESGDIQRRPLGEKILEKAIRFE